MSIGDVFVGVPQSKLAGVTILITLALISIFILVGKDKIAFGQKIAIVLLLVLLALPTILLTLFQINCVVTGAGARNPWCGWYAWVVAGLIVFYCIMLVFVSLTSFSKGENVLAAHQAADAVTREYFNNMEGSEEGTEQYEGMPPTDMLAAGKEGFTGPESSSSSGPPPPTKNVKDPFADYPGPTEKFNHGTGPSSPDVEPFSQEEEHAAF